MTEDRFESMIEGAAGRFEKEVEDSADRLDKSIDRAWSYIPVRIIGKALSYATGVGLVAGGIRLWGRGNDMVSIICFICGGMIIISEITALCILKKQK